MPADLPEWVTPTAHQVQVCGERLDQLLRERPGEPLFTGMLAGLDWVRAGSPSPITGRTGQPDRHTAIRETIEANGKGDHGWGATLVLMWLAGARENPPVSGVPAHPAAAR